MDRYLDVLDVEVTTRTSYEGYIRNHIRPLLGKLPLASSRARRSTSRARRSTRFTRFLVDAACTATADRSSSTPAAACGVPKVGLHLCAG
jgi:hypothetical protein